MTCGVREESIGKIENVRKKDYTYCGMVYSEHMNAARNRWARWSTACWKWAQNQTHLPLLSTQLIDCI